MGALTEELSLGHEEVTVQLVGTVPAWLDRKGINSYNDVLSDYADGTQKELRELGVISVWFSLHIQRAEIRATLRAICKQPEHVAEIRELLTKKLSEGFDHA